MAFPTLNARRRCSNRRGNQPDLPASNLLSFDRQEAPTGVGVNSPRRFELPLKTADKALTRAGARTSTKQSLITFYPGWVKQPVLTLNTSTNGIFAKLMANGKMRDSSRTNQPG